MKGRENDKTDPVMEPPSEQETGDPEACLKVWYRSSKFADLTIITPEKEFKVHKLVVCSQSGYFARMFTGNWLEANTNTVKLEGDDHRFVQTMVDFMYGFKYNTTEHGDMSPMMFHIGAYQIADKYDVVKMKTYVKGKFEKLAKLLWDMDDFALAITEVYNTTPVCERGLRDILAQVSHERLKGLLEKDVFVKVFEETPGFSADVARIFHKEGRHFKGCCCNWGNAGEGAACQYANNGDNSWS